MHDFRSFLSAAVPAAILAAGSFGGLLAAAQPDTAAVKALLQERVTVAVEIDQAMKRQHEVGRATFGEVLEIKSLLLSARFDACETKQQRIEILEEFVKLAEQQLKVVEAMVNSQAASQIDGLKAKAYLLKTRIDLARAMEAK
jgi:outer membrane protein TolC